MDHNSIRNRQHNMRRMGLIVTLRHVFLTIGNGRNLSRFLFTLMLHLPLDTVPRLERTVSSLLLNRTLVLIHVNVYGVRPNLRNKCFILHSIFFNFRAHTRSARVIVPMEIR